MVDVTTLEFYKEKPEKDGEKMIPYLNVERALDNELEYEWLKIVRAYEDDASVFDDQGKIIEGKKVKKMHLDLEYEKEQYKWPLNQTNYKTMLSDFGKESDNWEREFIKIKVHEWQSGTKGLVVISRKELKKLDVKIPERDEDGGDPSPSSSLNEFAFNPELEAGVIVNGIIEDLTADELRVTKKLILEVAESQLKGAKPELRKAVARDITSRKGIPTGE